MKRKKWRGEEEGGGYKGRKRKREKMVTVYPDNKEARDWLAGRAGKLTEDDRIDCSMEGRSEGGKSIDGRMEGKITKLDYCTMPHP